MWKFYFEGQSRKFHIIKPHFNVKNTKLVRIWWKSFLFGWKFSQNTLLKKIDAFSTKSIFFCTFFSALEVKHFYHAFCHLQWKQYKIQIRQERLNILSMLKFAGSHLAFYERKVSFSLISPIIFFTRAFI